MPVTPKFIPYLETCSGHIARQAVGTFSPASRKTVLLKFFVIVCNCLACLPALRQARFKHVSREPECNTSSTCDICAFLNSPRLRLGSLYDFKSSKCVRGGIGQALHEAHGHISSCESQLLKDCRTLWDHIVQHSLCRCQRLCIQFAHGTIFFLL